MKLWIDADAAPVAVKEICYRASDPTAILDAVRGGIGIGFLNHRAGRDDPDLVEVMPPLPEWDSQLWIVTHVDLHRSLKVQSFLTILKAQAQDWSCD